MPKTVERVAAITGTLHDGRNMIVLQAGKTVTVAESSIPFLEGKKALLGSEDADAGESGPTGQTDTGAASRSTDGEGVADGTITTPPSSGVAGLGAGDDTEDDGGEGDGDDDTGGGEDGVTKFAIGEEVFDVPAGYTVTDKGGAWYELTGPEGFEPQKVRGVDGVRSALSALASSDAPPA